MHPLGNLPEGFDPSLASPFLDADDPHQECVRRQREMGIPSCSCDKQTCTAECCAPAQEWWT